MKLSLVVPNLNEEAYLPIFLNSLRAQTFKDFEVIIIDGYSKDDSLGIICAFMKFLKIKLIINGTRNIGFIRSHGSTFAEGELLFHTSSDVYLKPDLLENIVRFFENSKLIALSGRTSPMGTSIVSKLAYKAFDLMRFIFTVSPMPIKKYRPSGSFFVVKRSVYQEIGGFPHVRINEDGLLGQKIDEYLLDHDEATATFSLALCIGHHAKRFEKVGGLKSLFFYLYVFGNMFPFLRRFLVHIERESARVFASRSDLKNENGNC